jgi:glycosyltransferase involved in cell wall biosynthesis
VLHVVFSLDSGGLENGIINMSNALDKQFEIHVCCLERLGRLAGRFAHKDRLRVIEKTAGFSVATVFRLASVVRAIRPKVLHTHNLGPLIYGSLASAFGRTVPIVHGEHGQFCDEDLQPKRLAQRRFFYRSTRRIHTVSRGQIAELSSYGLGNGKLQVVVNGVDADRFSPKDASATRHQYGIPAEDFVLGIVGRFGKEKNHITLLRAFERLRSRRAGIRLLIVGAGGPEEGEIRNLCKASREAEFISLMGFAPEPERLYPALDLLVSPSTCEGLSNVTIEAMACGVPVLSHRSCGSSEIIRSGVDGVVADISTFEFLASELDRLVSERDSLRLMGSRARQTVLERFSLDRMGREYATLYGEVAGHIA